MTDYEEVKAKLEQFPKFRERRFRANYLAVMTLRALGMESEYKSMKPKPNMTLEDIAEIGRKYDSYRNMWDKVTRENPHLKGSDHPDGEVLEQAWQLNQGYSPGYPQDIRQVINN